MKSKHWILAVSAVVVTILIVVVVIKREKKPQVTFERISRGDITATVTATGQINPIVESQVGTQVSGQIIKLYADFNSRVKKGQLLALIDPTPFKEALTQAQANLLNAQAGVAKAKATMDLDRTTYERDRTLPPELISKLDLDTARATYEAAAADFSASQAALMQAGANYKAVKFNLEHTRIISPLNGIVVSRNINIGQTVAASFQTPDLFDIAEDLKKMESDTNVVETDIGKVNVGQKAEFTVDAYPTTVFTGTVAIIRNAPITIQNVVNYDVIIYVNNKDLKLKPGMTTYVTIDVGKKDNILMVPNQALRFAPKGSEAIIQAYSKHHKLPAWALAGNEGNDGRIWYRTQKVWLYKGGEFIPVPLQTGIRNNNFTELTKGDLKKGDEVVTGYRTKQ